MTRTELNVFMRDRIGFDNCVPANVLPDCKVPSSQLVPPDYYLEVPCGKCVGCKKKHRLGWSIRLLQEIDNHSASTFLTLTLDDKYYSEFRSDPKRPLKLYIDRLRKELGFRPRYFFVSELGDEKEHTGRLHYHGIIFGTDVKRLPYSLQRGKWNYGISYTLPVSHKTANYLTKYLLKGTKDYKPFILCSNGIGSSYVNRKHFDWHLNSFDFRDWIMFNGSRYPLPQYYLRKFYSEDILLVRMLNRFRDQTPRKWYLNGQEFDDKRVYDLARKNYYRWTLRVGLSDPIIVKPNVLSIKPYGKFYFSESESFGSEEI